MATQRPDAENPPVGRLTGKQARFVEEYLVDLNATQAAVRAGYSERTANEQGARLLANVSLRAAISAAKEARSARTAVTADRVVEELALLGFSDVGQILDFSRADPRLRPASEIPDAARRALSSLKVRRHAEGHGEAARDVEVIEFKLWDKVAALDKLLRHLGGYPGGKDAKKLDLTSGGKPLEAPRSLPETVAKYAGAIDALLAGVGPGLPAPDRPGEPVDTD